MSAADVCSSSITIIISCTTMTDDTRPYVICIEWSLVLISKHINTFPSFVVASASHNILKVTERLFMAARERDREREKRRERERSGGRI